MTLREGRTDNQILSALLLSQQKLTTAEIRAFRSMLDALSTGQIKLSPPQRNWAEQVFFRLKLDQQPPPTAEVKSRVTPEHPLEKLPRPLKPPGRS